MKQFNIYKKDPDNFDAVKVGWSWPAFFFRSIWALSMRLWLIGFGIFAIYFIFITAGAQDILPGLALLEFIVLGIKGNEWRSKKLVSQGYKYLGKINASDPNDAINKFNELIEEDEEVVEDTKQCPYCAETIKKMAKKCRFCHEVLDEAIEKSNEISDRSTGEPVSKKSSMIEYYNGKWNFTFEYPADWYILSEDEPAGSWMIPISVAGAETSKGRPGFMINARKEEILQGNSGLKVTQVLDDGSIMEMPSTPQEFINLNKTHLPEQFTGYEDISSEVIQIDHKPAAKMVYSYDGQNGRIQEEMITLFGVGVTYQFICETPAGQYANLEPIFSRMLESFRIGRKSQVEIDQTEINDKTPEAVYNQGVRLYQNGEFEQAYQIFQKSFIDNSYKLQSAYAMTLCQEEMGCEPEIPEEIRDREDEITPAFIATNVIGGLIDNGFSAGMVKTGKTSEIEAEKNNDKYKINIINGFGFGGCFTNAWRIEGREKIPIKDSSLNPDPTESDLQILSLLRNVQSLGIMPIPEKGLQLDTNDANILQI